MPGREGTAFPLIAPYQVFRASDGDVMIAAGNDGLFNRLCEALELGELPDDERFRTNPDRVRHRDELAALLGDRLAGARLAEVLERLERAGVPAAPVNDVGQVADSEQTAALGLIQPLAEPTVAFPVSFDDERLVHRGGPPRLGEHTDEILHELGLDDEEIQRLAAQGVVGRVTSAS